MWIRPVEAQVSQATRPLGSCSRIDVYKRQPYPQNVETALNVEKIIRENGAVPATIAIIGGRLKAGLTPQEIDYLGTVSYTHLATSLGV